MASRTAQTEEFAGVVTTLDRVGIYRQATASQLVRAFEDNFLVRPTSQATIAVTYPITSRRQELIGQRSLRDLAEWFLCAVGDARA